jgi:RNA polymerase sigma-54 factor
MSVAAQKFSQVLVQTVHLSPEFQQAMKLLQCGTQELNDTIEAELLENPALERADDEPEKRDGEGEKDEQRQSELDKELEARIDALSGPDLYTPRSMDESEIPDEKAQPLAVPASLAGHLLAQLAGADISGKEKKLAEIVIRNLDANGYLEASDSELAEAAGASLQAITDSIAVVQSLEPAGTGARNLRECLLLQLSQRSERSSLSARIVSDHLDDLAHGRFREIERAENATTEEVQAAVRAIKKLDPRPGRHFSGDAAPAVLPDVQVIKLGGEYVVVPNGNGLPKLRLSSYCRELLRDPSHPEAKGYLRERVRAATWLIKSIHQRQQTIYRVAECIVRLQQEFFERGVEALKPLVLRDVAKALGMHESTVSRATTDKYIQTPRGVFELKYFFTASLRSEQGAVSSSAVKQRIKDLIAREKRSQPFTDLDIVRILKDSRIVIARRTVAKYRETMGIGSAQARRYGMS